MPNKATLQFHIRLRREVRSTHVREAIASFLFSRSVGRDIRSEMQGCNHRKQAIPEEHGLIEIRNSDESDRSCKKS